MIKDESIQIYNTYNSIGNLSPYALQKLFADFALRCTDIKPILAGIMLDEVIGNTSNAIILAQELNAYLDEYVADFEDLQEEYEEEKEDEN